LVSFANGEGGILILGVEEDEGEVVAIQNISNPGEREEAVQNVIDSRVEPAIRVDYEIAQYDEKTVLAFTVDDSDRIHSFETNGKPSIPKRQGTTTRYLNGYEIEDALTRESSASDLDSIQDIVSNRLNAISSRESRIENLGESPAVALHLIPENVNEATPTDIRSISDPRPFWAFAGGHTQIKGKEVLTSHRDRKRRGDRWGSYTLIRSNGVYEGVSIRGFYEARERQFLQCDVHERGPGLDAAVVLGIREGMSVLEELGNESKVWAYLSLVDAEGVSYQFNRGLWESVSEELETNRYSTDPAKLDPKRSSYMVQIERLLSEIHRAIGHREGTDNIEDAEWIGGEIEIGEEKLL
jgi:hypothetical protein